MKKIAILLLVLVLGLGVYIFVSSDSEQNSVQNTGPNSNKENPGVAQLPPPPSSPGDSMGASKAAEDEADEDQEGFVDQDERPASEVFSNAEDALKAVKQGAVDYDDILLEQFTQPGEDCTWCETFYSNLRNSINASETTQEERSYYAELLAISGRVENVHSLVEAIKSAGENDQADVLAEALELTVGGENVVKFLGEQLSTDNDLLKESVIAAITNQGSRTAAEMLYNQTVKSGDPDGYYSLGIGLGEFVPDQETLPYLKEIAMRRDQYSGLAVKAMLNSGLDGLKDVFDILSASKDLDADRQMLKDAVDHVSYEEDIENYLKDTLKNSKNPLVTEFSKQILDDFNQVQEETSEE